MTVFPWLVITVLVAFNALYVAAEFSAVAAQRSQLNQMARDGNRRAESLIGLLEDGHLLDKYIAACQIGITLSSLIAGAFGQATIGLELAPLLASTFDLTEVTAQSSAFLVVLLVLTVFQVVLGELVPKSLALQFPEKTAIATYLPTRFSVSVYAGFIWLLNGSALLLLKPFGVSPGGHQHVHSPEEIGLMLAESHLGGALSPEAHRRLQRGLQLSERTVRQLMTHRSEMVAIEAQIPTPELIERLLESSYGRVPVYRDSLDNIIGAVSTKDLVASFAAKGVVPPLDQLLRPLPFVPETLRAHRLVRFLQDEHSSKAIVVDEFGGVQGIVSIEDVLADVFGDIGDELKEAEPGAEMLPDGSVRLPGSMRLDEANHWLQSNWSSKASTVGGLIVNRLGRLPEEGEQLEVDGFQVTIEKMGPKLIDSIIATPLPSGSKTGEGANKAEG